MCVYTHKICQNVPLGVIYKSCSKKKKKKVLCIILPKIKAKKLINSRCSLKGGK